MKSVVGMVAAGLLLVYSGTALARDVEYRDGEVSIFVTPGEPTAVKFPGEVAGGVKRKLSSLSLEHRQNELVIFAGDGVTEQGEAIIVRTRDGRSYSVRIHRSSDANPRDDIVRIEDSRTAMIHGDPTEEPAYLERKFDYAPPSQVAGLMREMVLVAEFGKSSIPGYRTSDQYKGQVVMNDGTMQAVIDKIFIGPNLWGYVLDTTNMLEQSQKLNPATFRLDGTRAISAQHWEFAPKPVTIEEQIASQHTGKVYIVTRSRSGS